jgi:hypothetical protein
VRSLSLVGADRCRTNKLLAEKCHLGFASRTRSEQSDEQSAEQLQEVDHPETRIAHCGICASPDAIFGSHSDEAEQIYATNRQEVWREKTGAPRTAFAVHTYNEALPPDRAGTWHIGAVGCAARRADRPALRLSRRRRGRGQTGLARRRDAGRRRRLYGVVKLVPAERSLAEGALPIGLAHKVALLRDTAAGEIVRWVDVAVADSEAVRVRRDMEQRFAAPPALIAAQ